MIPLWLYNWCPNCKEKVTSLHSEKHNEKYVHFCKTCGFQSEEGAWLVGRDTEVLTYHERPSLDELITLIENFPFTLSNYKQRISLPPEEVTTVDLLIYFGDMEPLRITYLDYKSFLEGLKMAKQLGR
jgi:hypothetical protein